MTDHHLREYDRLVAEIGRYQEHIFTTFIYAITAAGTLFAFAYSEAVPNSSRWVILFTPWIIMFPCVILQSQRLRATWLIGLYMKNHLEPMFGLKWTAFITSFYQKDRSRKERTNQRFRDYGFTSSLALIIIQATCPILAAFHNPDYLKWLIITALVLGSLVIQLKMLSRSKASAELDKRIKTVLKELEV